jgi:hypothetical protein
VTLGNDPNSTEMLRIDLVTSSRSTTALPNISVAAILFLNNPWPRLLPQHVKIRTDKPITVSLAMHGRETHSSTPREGCFEIECLEEYQRKMT